MSIRPGDVIVDGDGSVPRPPPWRMAYQPGGMTERDIAIEFAIVAEAFDRVCPIVQAVARQGRCWPSKRDEQGLPLRQKWRLWRVGALAGRVLNERRVRIVESVGRNDITVIVTDSHPALTRGPSALLPAVDVIEFDSLLETTRRQLNGVFVRGAGRIVRRVCASIGIDSATWNWIEEGPAMASESSELYQVRHPGQRLNRTILFDYSTRLGFDPNVYFEEGQSNRIARLRH